MLQEQAGAAAEDVAVGGHGSAQFIADQGVHRFAFDGAGGDKFFQFSGGLFCEWAILQGGGVDVDVQCRAAQSRQPREYSDSRRR